MHLTIRAVSCVAFMIVWQCCCSASDGSGETPLELSLRIADPDDGKPHVLEGQTIGIEVYLRDERLHLKSEEELAKEHGAKEVTPVPVGTKEWPWFRGLSLTVERLVVSPDGAVTRVPVLEKLQWSALITSPGQDGQVRAHAGKHALLCVFELDPATSQGLMPGRYVVRATWKSTVPPADKMAIWHGELKTQDAEITVSVPQSAEEKAKVAYSQGLYYMRRNEFDKAAEQAVKAYELFPSYKLSSCCDLAGRAYEAKGDLASALKYYRVFAEAHKDANPGRFPYILKIRQKIATLEKQTEGAGKTGDVPDAPSP